MSVRVLRAGVLTTVQDLGRYGMQHLGIVPGGAMDVTSHRVANALVGNAGDAATLECTILGPALIFGRDSLVALYGAAFDAKVGKQPFPRNRPVLLAAGSALAIGSAVRGARAYLAIAGGFRVPEVLGSRSTYLPAAFGGLAGRALKAGDRIATADDLDTLSKARFQALARGGASGGPELRSFQWAAPEPTLPLDGGFAVRALEGRHFAQFDAAAQAAFYGEIWRVSADSNRMGYRLAGPALTRRRAVEILSEPTCLGTIQVPNDGTPIALMADHQTTGGYPKIAEIAGVGIGDLAQLAPGGSVRFLKCTLQEAVAARRQAQARLAAVTRNIEWKFGS